MKTKYIKEIDRVLAQNDISVSDISHVMAQFRQIIELEKLKEKYKFLNLYCNWCFHPKLEESKTIFRIFEFMVDAFVKHQNNPATAQWIGDAIIEGLSLHKLWSDILAISNDYNISSRRILADSNNWLIFGTRLLNVLEDKPLAFPENIETAPDGDIKKMFDAIRKKANSAFGPDQLVIINLKFIPDPNNEGNYLCQIGTLANKNILIHAPVAFRTQEMIDKTKK